ncbi:MAG: SGNH/GDSL hydrolase family protein [Desemzia incerta]|uniref:SGNH/GDSL hydrolase family protein n=1 Tax=Desemzia incerta TaxID=82801 RepID=UPI00331553B0
MTPEKLSGTIEFIGKNMFNPKKASIGSFIGNDNGSIGSGNNIYCLSDYIPVLPNVKYVKTDTLFTAFYKSPGVLSTVNPADSGSYLTIPSDAKYARTTFKTENINTSMFMQGESYPNTFVPFESIHEFDSTVYRIKPTNVHKKKTKNLFDPSKVTFGGYYDAAGNFVAIPNYGLSDYIEVNEGEVISKLTVGFSSWYDANKKPKGVWHTTRQAKVPKGVKYLRAVVNTANLNKEMVVKGYEYPAEYIPFETTAFDSTLDAVDSDKLRAMTSNLHGKKWAFLGDSLSDYLFSYPHLIAPKYSMRLVNMALSGRSMAKRTEATDTTYPPLISIYQEVPTDVDVITIWIGTNDKGSNVAIGDINSLDETTFFGAYNVMLSWLIDNRPNAKILLITPMQRSDELGQTGIPLIDYGNAVEQLGMKYGKRVLNMYKNSGIYVYSEVVKQKFIPDGLHPNYDGHKNFIAPAIEGAMLQI